MSVVIYYLKELNKEIVCVFDNASSKFICFYNLKVTHIYIFNKYENRYPTLSTAIKNNFLPDFWTGQTDPSICIFAESVVVPYPTQLRIVYITVPIFRENGNVLLNKARKQISANGSEWVTGNKQ